MTFRSTSFLTQTSITRLHYLPGLSLVSVLNGFWMFLKIISIADVPDIVVIPKSMLHPPLKKEFYWMLRILASPKYNVKLNKAILKSQL